MNKPAFEPAEIDVIADREVPVTLSEPTIVGNGFRAYQRYDLTLQGPSGKPLNQNRDIIRLGPVVAVLAFDPVRQLFVLIRQFRLAAHMATGKGKWPRSPPD